MKKYILFWVSLCGIVFLQAQENQFQTQINPQDVTIVRDQWGVPHIFGKTDADAAYGLAWTHAEDHFETVQQVYLLSKGMLGRVLGKKGAPGDYYYHALRLDDLVDSLMRTEVSPAFMTYLEGFCQGMNAYAEAHPEEVMHKKLFPIYPKDVLVGYPLRIAEFLGLGKVMGDVLAGKYRDQAEEVKFEDKGSNGFAFSRKITTDNRTYLIVNPHIGLEGPSSFWEAHMVSEEGMNFHGGMFPGAVGLSLGTNPHLGWAHTNNYFDYLDVYLLKSHPEDDNLYEFDGEWLELEEEKVGLKIKGIPVKIGRKTYWSKYGPTIKTDHGVYALRMFPIFTLKAPEQWYRMTKAQNFEQFQAALQLNGIPYFNIIYADREDNIYYLYNGLFPQRNSGYDWAGIVPGNTSRTLWKKAVPLAERPQILNPECGYVYNVNHNPFKCTCKSEWLDPADYDSLVNYTQIDDLPRSLRFRELYQDWDTISMSRLKEIKYDVTLPRSGPVEVFMQQLYDLDEKKYPELTEMIKLIRGWDRTAHPESVAATIMHRVFGQVGRTAIANLEKGKQMPESEVVELLTKAQAFLVQHFETIEVPFEQYSRIERGKKNIPVYGYTWTLGNRSGSTDPETGTSIARGGDSFMMFIQFAKEGLVELETIMAYGSSHRPDSPHFNDQMELFAKKGVKKMSLDKEKIMAQAERTYHPE